MSFDQAAAAYAFEQLVKHLQMRTDVQNIELMILSGFCRNCLSKWYHAGTARAGQPISYEQSCEQVYGMSYKEWKKTHQSAASEEQLRRLEETKAGHAKHEPVLQSPSPPESSMPQPQQKSSEAPVQALPPAPAAPAQLLSDVCCEPVSEPPLDAHKDVAHNTALPFPQREPILWSRVAQPEAEVEVRLGVLTVSDRAARGVYQDISGPEVLRCMHAFAASAGVRWRLHVPHKKLLADERQMIEDTMREWCGDGLGAPCNLVLSTGGTGLAPRDVTPALGAHRLAGPADLCRVYGAWLPWVPRLPWLLPARKSVSARALMLSQAAVAPFRFPAQA